MSLALFYAVLATLMVSLISLVGIATLSFSRRLLERGIFFLISLSAGALLGDVFLHLLPEMIHEQGGFTQSASLFVLAGIVLFFLLEKYIIWHHHHDIETPEDHASHQHSHTHSIGVMNLVGDGLHNLIDGMVIGASFLISVPVGIATTIAVVLHEIPQEIGDFGVLIHSGYSVKKALLLNFLTALLSVLGAAGVVLLAADVEVLMNMIIPLTAGGFIYIAGSDLIPELKKDAAKEQTFLQLLSLLLGMGLMFALLFLPFHGHGEEEHHDEQHVTISAEADHHDDDVFDDHEDDLHEDEPDA